ncbi:hypothetical protein Hdeb2414_s0005g00161151 [Helianthus debilis subsp. tardiflorus]
MILLNLYHSTPSTSYESKKKTHLFSVVRPLGNLQDYRRVRRCQPLGRNYLASRLAFGWSSWSRVKAAEHHHQD